MSAALKKLSLGWSTFLSNHLTWRWPGLCREQQTTGGISCHHAADAGGTVGQESHQQHVPHRFVHTTDTSLHSLRQTFPLSPPRQHIRRIHVVFYSSETVYDRLGSPGFLHSIAHSSQPSDASVRVRAGYRGWHHGDTGTARPRNTQRPSSSPSLAVTLRHSGEQGLPDTR